MRNYTNDISSVVGTGTLQLVNFKNFDSYDSPYTDNQLNGGSATVPASPYKLCLDFRPKRGSMTVTLNAVTASLVEWPTVPTGAGIVSVNWESGFVLCHSGDTGKAIVAIYKHWGAIVDSNFLNRIQKKVDSIDGIVGGAVTSISRLHCFLMGVPTADNINAIANITMGVGTSAAINLIRISATIGDNSGGITGSGKKLQIRVNVGDGSFSDLTLSATSSLPAGGTAVASGSCDVAGSTITAGVYVLDNSAMLGNINLWMEFQ